MILLNHLINEFCNVIVQINELTKGHLVALSLFQGIIKFSQIFLTKSKGCKIIQVANVTIERGSIQSSSAKAVFALDFFRVYHYQGWKFFLQLVKQRQRPFFFKTLRVLIIAFILTIRLPEYDMMTNTFLIVDGHGGYGSYNYRTCS